MNLYQSVRCARAIDKNGVRAKNKNDMHVRCKRRIETKEQKRNEGHCVCLQTVLRVHFMRLCMYFFTNIKNKSQ